MVEIRRHHADYLHCFPVELNSFPHDVWVVSKTPRPKAIRQDNNVISTRLEFFGLECAALCRWNAHKWKEVGGCCEAEQTFRCLSRFREITAEIVVGRHLVKNGILVVLVKKIGR
jgi:hypothetical protein